MSSQADKLLPVALSIAGFDPSGGAGVIADIRAFTGMGCFPTAAITSVTFQNTSGVSGAEHQSAETVRRQVIAVVEDNTVACTKTGMLPTRDVVREVARLFREMNLPSPVVDPVIRSTSGYYFLEEGALEELLKELLPLARLVTPNIPEAERITGLRVTDLEGMRLAAQAMREMGARTVLVKGGHLGDAQSDALGPQASGPLRSLKTFDEISSATDSKGSVVSQPQAEAGETPAVPKEAVDLLDNEGQVTVFQGEWIEGSTLRGTGCTLSAAIAACLGRGMALEESVSKAKQFVAEAIRASAATTPDKAG